jgi:hypothetical protein
MAVTDRTVGGGSEFIGYREFTSAALDTNVRDGNFKMVLEGPDGVRVFEQCGPADDAHRIAGLLGAAGVKVTERRWLGALQLDDHAPAQAARRAPTGTRSSRKNYAQTAGVAVAGAVVLLLIGAILLAITGSTNSFCNSALGEFEQETGAASAAQCMGAAIGNWIGIGLLVSGGVCLVSAVVAGLAAVAG